MLASTSNGILVGGILAFVVTLIAVLAVTDALLPAALAAACMSVAFNLWAWKRADMFPIPKQSANAALAASGFLAGLWALLAIFG